jgi:hypothetical protein
MSHLNLVPGTSHTAPNEKPASDTVAATKTTACCPISAADEFSHRNPGVLGEALVNASRHAINAAAKGDHEDTERMLSWLASLTSDTYTYDDHASRHLVEGICNALHRAVTHTQYIHARNASQSEYLDRDEYDADDYEDAGSRSRPRRPSDSDVRAEWSRIRVHRPRTQLVTPTNDHADTHDTTH